MDGTKLDKKKPHDDDDDDDVISAPTITDRFYM